MNHAWNDVFQSDLGSDGRAYVNEPITVRNAWERRQPFALNDACRAFDAMARLLSMIAAPEHTETSDRNRRSGCSLPASADGFVWRGVSGAQTQARDGHPPPGHFCRTLPRMLPTGGVRRQPFPSDDRARIRRIPHPKGLFRPHLHQGRRRWRQVCRRRDVVTRFVTRLAHAEPTPSSVVRLGD